MNPLDALIGQPYEWTTIGGEHFAGIVVDTDNGTLIVRLPDGSEKAVSAG